MQSFSLLADVAARDVPLYYIIYIWPVVLLLE